jgi:hypothetical protein
MFSTGPAARSPAETPKAVNTRQRARRWSLGEQSSTAGPALSHLPQREEVPLESLTDTLIERVDKLVHASKAPREWGSPHLSTTPTSVELAAEIAALQSAVQEIALEVQKLSAQGEALEKLLGAAPSPPHPIR